MRNANLPSQNARYGQEVRRPNFGNVTTTVPDLLRRRYWIQINRMSAGKVTNRFPTQHRITERNYLVFHELLAGLAEEEAPKFGLTLVFLSESGWWLRHRRDGTSRVNTMEKTSHLCCLLCKCWNARTTNEFYVMETCTFIVNN
ncbi:uncharacterized protein LOC135843899 [Planococcus citri]|uniref:uncharacterized protein LOC135843899 n=1 Tax=Planococcus citri TaxID=170843 RepID=UPI0031F85817